MAIAIAEVAATGADLRDEYAQDGHAVALLTSDARIERSGAPISSPIITIQPVGGG